MHYLLAEEIKQTSVYLSHTFLSFEGGHFGAKFERKIARLRWTKFDVRVPLCKECAED